METDPNVFREFNLDFTKDLWCYCAKHNVPLIYASSASVYGNGSLGFCDSLENNKHYKPLNLYGKSKHDFDIWATQQDKTPPHWFGLRYFNVYGSFESHKGGQASMVFHGFKQIVQTGKIRLFKSLHPDYPDGGQMRDFIYVDDIINVTLELLTRILKSKQGLDDSFIFPKKDVFLNLGTGKARTWNDLANAIFIAMGKTPNIEYFNPPKNIADHYQYFTQADLSTYRNLKLKLR